MAALHSLLHPTSVNTFTRPPIVGLKRKELFDEEEGDEEGAVADLMAVAKTSVPKPDKKPEIFQRLSTVIDPPFSEMVYVNSGEFLLKHYLNRKGKWWNEGQIVTCPEGCFEKRWKSGQKDIPSIIVQHIIAVHWSQPTPNSWTKCEFCNLRYPTKTSRRYCCRRKVSFNLHKKFFY